MTATETLRPTYNLDVAGAQRLEAELGAVDASAYDGDQLRLDLTDVAFVASSGLRVMLKWAQEFDRHGFSLVVTNANDTVREVFSMSGFDTILKVE